MLYLCVTHPLYVARRMWQEVDLSDGNECETIESLSFSCFDKAQANKTAKAWPNGVVDLKLIDGFANNIFEVVFAILLADKMGYQAKVPNIMGSDHPFYRNSSKVREGFRIICAYITRDLYRQMYMYTCCKQEISETESSICTEMMINYENTNTYIYIIYICVYLVQTRSIIKEL